MKSLAKVLVKGRIFILLFFILVTITSAVLSRYVTENSDMTKYLPESSLTKAGTDLMNREFKAEDDKSSVLKVMFENLTDSQKTNVLQRLKKLDGISEVTYENTDEYNKEQYTLYILNIKDKADSEAAKDVYTKVKNEFKNFTYVLGGGIANYQTPILPSWILLVVVILVLIILTIMCESFVEPFLFLVCIFMAIIINMGTNVMFSSVSDITIAIAAILQLALSMDYSIMLMERYRQESKLESDKKKAMQNALCKAFQSISGSSVTTIVGLLTLVFMSFTIGRDMGLVLAKGVLLSLLCIFCVLPALILIFDKWIKKTTKKSPIFRLDHLGKGIYKLKTPLCILFVIIFVASYFLQGKLLISYTGTEDTDKITKVFGTSNQLAIVYKNDDEQKIRALYPLLEGNEKIKTVTGYGNTLDKEFTYQEMKKKLSEMDKTFSTDDYLMKLIYYKYFNQNISNTMTIKELIDFLKSNVYNKKEMSDEITEDVKNDIEKLKNFAEADLIIQKRSASNIADVLRMSKADVKNIMVLYRSKQSDTMLTINEFLAFLKNDVQNDDEYSKYIDESAKSSLDELKKYTNHSVNNTPKTADEMAAYLGISKSDVRQLYVYYILKNGTSVTMTMREFAEFVSGSLYDDPNYKDMFDSATKTDIAMILTFSDTQTINREMKAAELSALFGIPQETVQQILLSYYMNRDNGLVLSLPEVYQFLQSDTVKQYLGDMDLSAIRQLEIFIKNENDFNTTKLSKAYLNTVFDSIAPGLVELVYQSAGLPEDASFTPQEFVDTVLQSEALPEESKASLLLLKNVIDATVSGQKLTAAETAELFGIDIVKCYNLYALAAYVNGGTDNWTLTPYKMTEYILGSDTIKGDLDETATRNLSTLKSIMDNTLDNVKFSYEQLSAALGIHSETVKSIYALYDSKTTTHTILPYNFITFLLENQKDETLAGSLNADMVQSLKQLQNILTAVSNKQALSAAGMSDILKFSASDVELLYGLYDFKNGNNTMSLQAFVSFILSDVVNHKDYGASIDDTSKEQLAVLKEIMADSLTKKPYTREQTFSKLQMLSPDIKNDTIKVLYLYYGSDKTYDDNYRLTVQEFIAYLNKDILQDSSLTSFIDNDLRKDIIDAQKSIDDSIKLLVGKEYSRIVLDTKFEYEDEEVFTFISDIRAKLANISDNAYLVGDSTMAYEMSKTFQCEFNFMSILTMIAIFIVVAFAFKSLIIPFVLVLIIQSAVYMTMAAMSFSGTPVYFISILIVQSILMGATIDYAILYTSYYLEHRKSMNVKDAIIQSYNKSINTIITSASILIIATLIVGMNATGIIAKICQTISIGAICATVLILFFVPALIAAIDKWACVRQ